MPRTDLDVTVLVAAYRSGESAASLARRFNANVWSVLNRLRKAGCTIRTRIAQNEQRLALNRQQAADFKALVDGVLLGDGSIDLKGLLRLEQAHMRHGWLLQVESALQALGGACRIVPIPPRTRQLEGRTIRSGGGRLLYTPAYVELKSERRRWYPKGRKRVPIDVRLTPVSLAHWFAGDGTCDSAGTLTFCTNGFTRACVDLLVAQLRTQLEVSARRIPGTRPKQYKIAVTDKVEALHVADIVRPHLPACCRYKLRFVRMPKRAQQPRKLSTVQVASLKARRRDGASYSTLAKEFNVSPSLVAKLLTGQTYKEDSSNVQ